MKITVQKLETPVYSGDWHDPPLKWSVNGPGEEVQLFYTKANALMYKKVRPRAANMAEASYLYGKMLK